MKERPILFSAAMVRAILAGRKTQTRRPVAGSPVFVTQFIGRDNKPTHEYGLHPESEYVISKNIRCPLGQPGDRLWVRETWALEDCERDGERVIWRADRASAWLLAPETLGQVLWLSSDYEPPLWRPSIHMPRWASRLTLEIADVRAQRVQDVTSADIEADIPSLEFYGGPGAPDWSEQRRSAWAALWSSIYGSESWQQNSWVWAVTFRRLP